MRFRTGVNSSSSPNIKDILRLSPPPLFRFFRRPACDLLSTVPRPPLRSMKTFSSIRQKAFRWAAQRIQTQPDAPVSPCSVSDAGDVSLCAAAAIAAGGLEVARGSRARRAFERRLAQSRQRSLVFDTFARLGWPATDCGEKMRFNDAQSASRRRQAVTRYLQLAADAP